MRFSIIIPVYNVEDYLEKCLDSIANQSFTDYEVIIMDDETPDNSMMIAEKYVEAYPEKFKIIHQKNTGQGGARNNGAAIAQGEYLLFVDSDDYVHTQMLEILDGKLRETPCEMMIFNYHTATPSGTVLSDVNIIQEDKIVEGDEKNIQMQNPPAPWNKVFSRSFFLESNVRFPERVWYEDAFTKILIAKAQRIRLCTEKLYFYVQRPGSVMNSGVSARVLEIKTILDLMFKKCKEDNIYDAYRDAIDASMLCSLSCVIELVHDQDAKHPYIRELLQYLVEKFPAYESNPVLFPIVKSKMKCLMKGNHLEYSLRFRVLPHVKRLLLRNSIVSKLNDWRKHRK